VRVGTREAADRRVRSDDRAGLRCPTAATSIDDIDRFDDVAVIGVDEHVKRPQV
jgi:hypothetical protein